MTNEKNLTIAEQLKAQTNTPKTETRIILEQEDLYPDLVYEDISTYHKSYGPMGANETKYCSNCKKSVTVSSSSAKYCPDCGTAFGTVAEKSKAQTQNDKHVEKASKEGGSATYTCVTTPDGTTVENATYKKP